MIEDTFLKLKSNLELTPTFADMVSQRHSAIRSAIKNSGLSVRATTKLIGSLSRQTRIQPRIGDKFDIDILVVLDDFVSWLPSGGITTQMAMNEVLDAVDSVDRYAKMNPEQDHPTVTFAYANDVKVELVPAYLDRIGQSVNGTPHSPVGRAYWVSGRNGIWELADYDYEADFISATNQSCGGLLIPTIKMLKAAKREHFPSMKSYHLEVIATHTIPRTIAGYRGQGMTPTYPLLIGSFLYHFDNWLSQAWSIPGSLTPAFTIDPLSQVEIGLRAAWIKQQLNLALHGTDGEKHRAWRAIFGESLPLP